MIPKFRVYDSGSLCRMYQPEEVMVGDGNIWINDEDFSEWIVNNDLHLMQSTALLDKNGKEIFEGDILKVANNDSSWFEVVKYDHEKAMFISKEVNLKYEVPETTLYDLFSPYPFKVEVIGNIWENPDLLGTKLGSEE